MSVTLSVKPSRRDEFLSVIRANQAGTLSTEPLARGYTFGENTETPNVFHFQEQFASEDGFKAHTKTEHFQKVSYSLTAIMS